MYDLKDTEVPVSVRVCLWRGGEGCALRCGGEDHRSINDLAGVRIRVLGQGLG